MRNIIFSIATLACLAGCEQPQFDLSMFDRPAPAPELAQLERFAGSWSGTAEMVSPTAEDMNKMLPEGQEFPQYSKGSNTAKWVLGGKFLMLEGWHEMPNGEKDNFIEFMTWDPTIKKYRSWYFSDYGEFGEGKFKFSDDGKKLKMKMKGVDHEGQRTAGGGTIDFVSDDQMDWTWEEGNFWFKFKLKGSSMRQ